MFNRALLGCFAGYNTLVAALALYYPKQNSKDDDSNSSSAARQFQGHRRKATGYPSTVRSHGKSTRDYHKMSAESTANPSPLVKGLENQVQNKDVFLSDKGVSDFVTKAVDIAMPSVVSILAPDISFLGCEGGRGGTGFVISSTENKVLILTNYHVIQDTKVVVVISAEDVKSQGRVVLIDSSTDLALIEATTIAVMPSVKLGDSAEVKAGEFVAAIGRSEGLHNSVTIGIVSRPERGVKELLKTAPFPDNNAKLWTNCTMWVQTDAGIHSGNSGGPLINMKGEVIAVNTLEEVPGIYWSIPVSEVERFLEEYKEFKLTGKKKDSSEEYIYHPIFYRHNTEDKVSDFWNRDK